MEGRGGRSASSSHPPLAVETWIHLGSTPQAVYLLALQKDDLVEVGYLEAAARRVQSIVDAYHLGADKQDWGNSKLFTEVRSADNLVSPALKTWAARKGKEEVELQKARRQAKELMRPGGGAYALEAAAGAVAGGALPDGGKGRGRGRGRGRGLMPPGDP